MRATIDPDALPVTEQVKRIVEDRERKRNKQIGDQWEADLREAWDALDAFEKSGIYPHRAEQLRRFLLHFGPEP